MGKKVKNLVKKVAKGASLGLVGGGNNLLGNALDLVAPGIGRNLSDQFLGTDLTGAKADAEKMAAQEAARQQALATQAANAQVDLSNTNVADIQAGGTSAALAASSKKRRGAAGGVAASLGINV